MYIFFDAATMCTIVLPSPCVQQGDALQGRQSQQESFGCALRALVHPSLHSGSCRCSSSVVNFRCSVTRRFTSLGAQAVTWLHSQCAWRVKHSWVHFLTDSLCVLSRFGSARSLFSFLVVSVCWMPFLFCFCFGSNGFYARRCFVHLEMYSHCRWVPALRGQLLLGRTRCEGMCNQFTLHHKFRIDTGRTKFRQGKTDGILYGRESHGQGTQRSIQA